MNNPHLNKYISSLRSYNRSSYGPRPKIPDFFMESQKSLSMKDYIKYCDNARIQKDLINRLVTLPEHKLPVIKNNNQGKIGKKNNGYHNSQIIK